MQRFIEYAQARDDRIRRYVVYLANIHNESLEEAAGRSMGHIWQQMSDGKNHAIITAFRGERELPDNRKVNNALAADIRRLGWGFVPVLGGYREKVRERASPAGLHHVDPVGNETDAEIDVDEESFFVTASNDRGSFKAQVTELVRKYIQQAALIKYGDDDVTYEILPSGQERALGQWKTDKLAQLYTKMKKGPRNRKFTFEAAGDLTRSTLMAVDGFFGE